VIAAFTTLTTSAVGISRNTVFNCSARYSPPRSLPRAPVNPKTPAFSVFEGKNAQPATVYPESEIEES